MEIVETEWRLYTQHAVDNPLDDNIDVFVEWRGRRFGCAIYTIQNVKRLMTRWHDTGEHGAIYFWAANALIVPRIDTVTLRQVVGDLVKLDRIAAVMYELDEV